MNKFLFLALICLFFYPRKANSELASARKFTLEIYLEFFEPFAIKEMNRTGIPASITIAQAILESGYGNSTLAIYANNHFGMKFKPDWNGETFTIGKNCYKKYNSIVESYEDHSNHIKAKKWYASLFNLKITDYKNWAIGLKNAGYAEAPNYAYYLISIIEKYKFDKLDTYYSPVDSSLTEK